MVCDKCGVKVALRSTRRTRFGHIELTTDLQHPFDAETALSCFPVIPADFIASLAGRRLQALYDELIESNTNHKHFQVVETATAIVECLTPVVVTFHNWGVSPECNTLARGMALQSRP